MTGEQRSAPGLVVAVAGSIGLIISLWQPWYSFSFPTATLDQVQQSSSQYGILGPLINQGAQLIRQIGTFHVTAWQAYTVIPALLLVAGAVAGGLSLLMLSNRANGVASAAAKVGGVAVGATVYRMIDRPLHSDQFHVAWGLYLALGCAVAIVGGALMAAAADGGRSRVVVIPHAPDAAAAIGATWSTADSVSPPSS